jgi:hypothetical protein
VTGSPLSIGVQDEFRRAVLADDPFTFSSLREVAFYICFFPEEHPTENLRHVLNVSLKRVGVRGRRPPE